MDGIQPKITSHENQESTTHNRESIDSELI